MPAPKTTYCPPFRSLWFGDDEIDDGALWPRGKSLKYKLEEILGVDHKSYGSNRKNETPHFRTFICASHCGCQFKVKAVRISDADARPGADLQLSLAQHSGVDVPLASGKYLKLPHQLDRECERIVRDKKPIRAYGEIKSKHPRQLERIAAVLNGSANDGTQRKLDGQQRLAQAVRNKRKQFLANNHKVATSFDEVIQEVQKQGFVSLGGRRPRSMRGTSQM